MALSCLLETSQYAPGKTVPFFHKSVIDLLLAKLVQSRWPDNGLVLFWLFTGIYDSVLVHKCAKKHLANIQLS